MPEDINNEQKEQSNIQEKPETDTAKITKAIDKEAFRKLFIKGGMRSIFEGGADKKEPLTIEEHNELMEKCQKIIKKYNI